MCSATKTSFSKLILFSAMTLFVGEAGAQERCMFPPDKVWEAPQTPDQRVVLGFDYPYERSAESYLFVNGMPYPYEPGAQKVSNLMTTARIRTGNGEDGYETVGAFMERLGLSPADMNERTAVIGYGSNSAPSALTRKFVNVKYNHVAVFPVVKSTIEGFDVVYSPHLVFNGAMPATLAPSHKDTRVDVYITWLDDDKELKRMHESEGVGEMYSYGKLTDVEIALDPKLELGALEEAFIYIDCYGALTLDKTDGSLLAIKKVHAEKRRFTPFDQRDATEKIIELIGSNSSADAFICQNVQYRESRETNTEKLKEFRVLFKDKRYTPDSDKTCLRSLKSGG